MKRIILLSLILLSLSISTLSAQVLNNPSFELLNDTIPNNWTLGEGSRVTTNYTNSGSNAISVWNWYYYAAGWVVNGSFPDSSPSQFRWQLAGEPIAEKVAGLTGYYYFDTINSGYGADTAYIAVLLKRYDTTAQKMDTVGFGEAFILPYELTGGAGLQQFDLEITDLMPGVEPDSVAILIASRNNDNACMVAGDGNCLYLYVDDLAFRTTPLDTSGPVDTTTSINTPIGKELISIYPNPAVSSVSILSTESGSIRLLDMQGRLLLDRPLVAGRSQLDISELVQGVYILEAVSDNNQIHRQRIVKSE